MGPFPEAVEADVARFYPGRSVGQFWRGEMSLRELRVLVTNLPAESATARRLRGHNWSDRDYMLADLLDTVRFHRTEWAMAHGAKPAKPKPVDRPPSRAATDRPAVTERALAQAAHQHVLAQVMPGRAGQETADS